MSEQPKFSLKQMQLQTPAVNPVEAMRRQLALGLMGSVSETDMGKLAAKLKEMALGGDLKAMKMLLDLMMPKAEKETPPEPQGVKALAEALQDLVDEIRIGNADAPRGKRPLLNGPRDEEEES